MTTLANSGRMPVRISRSARIVDIGDLVETVALVCGPCASGPDLQLAEVDADAVLVRTAEDLAAEHIAAADAYWVVPGGLDLMQELLSEGRIAGNAPILWSLGLPVSESLDALEALELPAGLIITGFAGVAHHAVLLSAAEQDATHDPASFRMGLKAARLESSWADARSDAEEHAAGRRLLQDLRTKHLSLLSSLGPAGQPAPAGADSDGGGADVAGLQDQITLLERKYASLERKYNALAQSKLGRITLKLWDRKRLSAPGIPTTTRSKR